MPLPIASLESTRKKLRFASSDLVSVLSVGDWTNREFATAMTDIEDADSWQTVADIHLALDCLQGCDTPPDLIVLAQSVPGEYRQCDIDRLCELAPLSRIIVVAGTWCEGEMRTGLRLQGTLRLYWYEFASWWQSAMRNLAAGFCPPWSLPLDNPQAGRCSTASHSSFDQFTGTILIDAADFSVFESLAAALARVGINATWRRHADSASLSSDLAAGIWDGGQLSDRELARLTAFCDTVRKHGGKVVVLLDFPRIEHIEQTRAAGASSVFGKPYILDELLAALC